MARRSLFVCIIASALACHDVPVPTHPVIEDGAPAASAVLQRIDLGTLGGRSSYATDVNDAGTVVGWSQNASGAQRAFRWTEADGMVDLGALPGHEWSRALSIMDDGRILGVSGTSYSATVPVVWSPSREIAELPIPLLPGAEFGEPTDFNARGEVAGWDVVEAQHAWSWSESWGKIDITARVPEGSYEGAASAINASGLIVGTNHARVCITDPSCWHAFLWSVDGGYRDIGTPVDDPDATSMGLGLNDAGTVVGLTRIPMGSLVRSHPYRWTQHEGFTLLPSSSYGYALAISERGTAVGASWDPEHEAIQAVAWPQEGGVVKLSPGEPHAQVAVAINDAGAVAGWSSLGEESHATLWILDPAALASAEVGRETVPRPQSGPVLPAGDCLSDSRALVSRAALFACVARSGTKP